MKTFLTISLLFSCTALILLFNIYFLSGSSLKDPAMLAFELVGYNRNNPPQTWIHQWMWEQASPYKFRILGKYLLWISWKLTGDGNDAKEFYRLFVFWCFFWLFGTVLLLYSYLRILISAICEREKYVRQLAFTGCLLFLTAAPILAGFKFPVHTGPNDLLGYFLIIAGMIAIIKEKPVPMCATASVAVFCRETTLIIPFIYLVSSRDRLPKKLGLSCVPVLIWLIYRFAWWESYSPFKDSKHNIQYPLETISFFLTVFGALWILGFAGYYSIRKNYTQYPVLWEPLMKSFPLCLVLVIAISLVFARIRELRIVFILFIFFIPLSVAWVYLARDYLKKYLRTFAYWIYLGGAGAIIWVAHEMFTPPMQASRHIYFLKTFNHFYGGFGGGWAGVFPFYLFSVFAIIPVVFGWCARNWSTRIERE